MLSEQQSHVSSSIPELNGPSVQERFQHELLPPEIEIGRLLTSSGIQLMDITRGKKH